MLGATAPKFALYAQFRVLTADQLGSADPAAEEFQYPVSFDIRDLVTLEDVIEECELGPNGYALSQRSSLSKYALGSIKTASKACYVGVGACSIAWSIWRRTWMSGLGKNWRQVMLQYCLYAFVNTLTACC